MLSIYLGGCKVSFEGYVMVYCFGRSMYVLVPGQEGFYNQRMIRIVFLLGFLTILAGQFPFSFLSIS
jgi:hypothetical protein